MKLIIAIIGIILFQSNAYSSMKVKKYIKDPIDDKYQCIAHNVKWQGDKLVTITKSSGHIICEHTGYKAYIFNEDRISEKEKKSIYDFLKFAKKHLNIKDKFDFHKIGLINELWLLKNIYERRNLTPRQHIKILNIFKEATSALLEDIIIDQQELNYFCVGKDDEDKWCRSTVFKNKIWEGQHSIQVELSNRNTKIQHQKEKLDQRERERNQSTHFCEKHEIAEYLSNSAIKSRLKDKINYKRDKKGDFDGTSPYGELLFSFRYLTTGNIKPSDFKWWIVKINKSTCETTISPGR